MRRGDGIYGGARETRYAEAIVEQFWTAQINDLVGGWIVTSYPHPLSQHDLRPHPEDPAKKGYVIAECMTEEDAEVIATLLNIQGERRAHRK